MSNIDDIMNHNNDFVENKEYEQFLTGKFPDKKMVIVTCMDTRLVELLPKAMNLRNGDAKIIKNAGAIITQPFGNIMRSVLIALYELEANEVLVVGHYECGMIGINSQKIVEKFKLSGVSQTTLDTLYHSGMDLNRWLQGFDSVKEGVEKSVQIIRNQPLLPKNTPVHGMIIHPRTGKLELINDGYAYLALHDHKKPLTE